MEATPACAAYNVPGSPMAWTATLPPNRAGLFDRRFELGERVLIRRMQHAVAHRIRTGLVDLDEVRALLMLLPDRRHEFIRGVGIGRVRQNLLRGIESIGVLVAAENIDGIAGDPQPWPGYQALVDGVTHRAVGRSRTLGAHVALGGEPGHEIFPCREDRQHGSLRHGFFHGLQVFRARMKE